MKSEQQIACYRRTATVSVHRR